MTDMTVLDHNERLTIEKQALLQEVGTLRAVLGAVARKHMQNKKGWTFDIDQSELGEWVVDMEPNGTQVALTVREVRQSGDTSQ